METRQPPIDRLDPGMFDVVFVLLLLQTAFALVSLLGTIAIGAGLGALPALTGAILLGLAGAGATLLLAIGLARLRRWARNTAVVYESLLLLGLLLRLLVGRRFSFGLVPLTTEFALPLAVIALLLNRTARRTLAAARRPTPPTRLAPPATPLDRAA
jgi:hypothetical protein